MQANRATRISPVLEEIITINSEIFNITLTLQTMLLLVILLLAAPSSPKLLAAAIGAFPLSSADRPDRLHGLTSLTPIGGKDIGLPRVNENLDGYP
jgi:hypothetical protein